MSSIEYRFKDNSTFIFEEFLVKETNKTNILLIADNMHIEVVPGYLQDLAFLRLSDENILFPAIVPPISAYIPAKELVYLPVFSYNNTVQCRLSNLTTIRMYTNDRKKGPG